MTTPPGRPVPGAILFARYAYPPNALGYCGPADATALLEYAASGTVDRGLVELARGFEGAWPYLELIAAANAIDDPLDRRVVEAYWIGGPLLDHIPPALLAASLEMRFHRRAARRWVHVAQAMDAGAVAHHNLHVFGVSPWIGLLRDGVVTPALTVLDRCRIRAGWVEAVDGGSAIVRSRPLEWDGRRLHLGAPVAEPATVSLDGLALVDVRVGDWVAVHWGWICDRLGAGQRRALHDATVRALSAAQLDAGPRPVVGRHG